MKSQLRERSKKLTKTTKPKDEKKTLDSQDPKQSYEESIKLWRLIARKVAIFSLIMIVIYSYYYYDKWNSLKTMASRNAILSGSPIGEFMTCSNDYQLEKVRYPNCAPTKCGRFVTDSVISREEAFVLRLTAETLFSLVEPSGGVSIFDFTSGTLSNGTKFINFYKSFEDHSKILSPKSFEVFRLITDKIADAISLKLGINAQELKLTSPAFLTRITSKSAQTLNDQYWHSHIDKITYDSFVYTSLLYLSTYQSDFGGGRFIFLNPSHNITVEPKFGRLLFFTSGSENEHMVEKVSLGERFALTIPFSCDPQKAAKKF